MGFPPVELRSLTPQGGEAAALPFGRTRGFKPRVRYNLIRLSNLVNLDTEFQRTTCSLQAIPDLGGNLSANQEVKL